MLKVMSVYGSIGPTNVPIEAFLSRGTGLVERFVVSSNQTDVEAVRAVCDCYPLATTSAFGLRCGRRGIRGVRKLLRLMRKVRPDVVHVHHATSAAVSAMIAKVFCRAGVVFTLHNDFRKMLWRQKLCVFVAMVFADVILFNSHATSHSMPIWATRVLGRKARRVVYNGVRKVDSDGRRKATREDCSHVWENGFAVLWVGRFVPQKNVNVLIEAFALVQRTLPNSVLVLAGEGELRSAIEGRCDELGIRQSVKFLGLVSRETIWQLNCASDVMVVPSRFEGFCNAMVEAMLASKPVVASDIPVLREVLGEGCGRFFPVGDAEQLAKEIMVLAADKGLRESLGVAAHQRATSFFTLESAARKQGRCYQSLARRRQRGGAV